MLHSHSRWSAHRALGYRRDRRAAEPESDDIQERYQDTRLYELHPTMISNGGLVAFSVKVRAMSELRKLPWVAKPISKEKMWN